MNTNKLNNKLIIAGIIGPVFYFVILTVLGLMWEGYNPITQSMSEIGSVDSPFKDLMNLLGFSLLGINIILFTLGIKKEFENNQKMKPVYILMIIGGLVMFLVGFFPCDSGCIDVTIIGQLHSLTSTIAAILIPLAIILSSLGLSTEKEWGQKWSYISFILGMLSMSTGLIMFIEALDIYIGLIQRLGIGLSLLWILIVSIKITIKQKE